MSELPATFDNAIEEAELHAFGVLCAATGMTSGRNAFIGDAGEQIGVMVFGFTDSFQPDPSFWAKHNFTELPFNAEALGRFRTRREVWRWVLRIVKALPITVQTGTLRVFRVERLNAIVAVTAPDENGKQQLVGWQMTVQFNTVCLTSGTAEAGA